MIKVNEDFLKLSQNYLFSEVGKKIKTYETSHPEVEVIRMGIGDVTLPICEVAVKAMHTAAEDLGSKSSFHGYGPERGYDFLSSKIREYDYLKRGIDISLEEIFINDGAKSDLGNIGDILSRDNKVAVTDPVYPVYVDSNVMSGRAGEIADGLWGNIIYIPCVEKNNFIPEFPKEVPDIIYLCYPNNPVGNALTKDELKQWVDYALANKSIILFDSAYESFIRSENIPHSIYEIEGAKRCAIEFRSFSKTAGFTGLRCGYTVVPKELMAYTDDGKAVELNHLWNRRQCTKFNGASYVSQRAAESLYTEEGQEQVKEAIDYYLLNAKLLREGFSNAGFKTFGGTDSPYIWIKSPDGVSSWEFFDKLLEQCNIAGTPGVGFGPSGEGYVRLTGFNTHEKTREAVVRIKLYK